MTPPPLLETKLYPPRARHGLVPRPRLDERLDAGLGSTLLLVSAPPGFGKTTLVATRLAGRPRVAWVSLDAGDDDPTTFWTYVVAAIRTTVPEVGEAELAHLRSPEPPPLRSLLTTLLNDLAHVPGEVVLVLDDYHVVDSHDVHDGLAFLLEHGPPQLHVVVSSRADPPLPLARLRARGELVEVRAADLRFTTEEATTYLADVMGLALSTGDVAALEARTEGWIAALQLAALSVRGREDVAGFVEGFAGDDRFVVDYLVEEVVARQPERLRSFLLRTSVLTRLNGPLCDAVTGHDDGRATLEELDRANLLLVPLDDRRHWYRYHHLFADVLRARLSAESPELVPDLHRRASTWHEEHGDPGAALEHAMAAGDDERAADLLVAAMPALRRDRQERLLRDAISRLPAEVVRTRPVLGIGYVGALLSTGRTEGVEPLLRSVEQWLADTPAADRDSEHRRLPGWVEVYRAGLAMALADAPTTVAHARRALGLLDEDDDLGHGAASALLGLASWTAGDLDDAHAAYVEATDRLGHAGHVSDVLGCSIALGDLRQAQGRLDDALATYDRALLLAGGGGGPVLRGTADMYVASSTVHHERGDLALATSLLDRAVALGEHTGLPQNAYRLRVARARLHQAEGDLDGAARLLEEAERVYVGDFSPDVRPVTASLARVRVAQGRLGDAFAWVRRRGLSADDDLSYLREFEHLTLARALLARHRTHRGGPDHGASDLDAASRLLARLLLAAEAGGRAGTVVEVLVLQALAEHERGDVQAALRALARALDLAAPEQYLRVLADEGAPMSALLVTARRHGVAPTAVDRVLGVIAGGAPAASRSEVSAHVPAGPTSATALVDPLSERELDVLRLLGSELSGPGIARELTVSLNTVRTHTKSIYAKLGVNSRRSAVRRAAELDLLRHGRGRRT